MRIEARGPELSEEERLSILTVNLLNGVAALSLTLVGKREDHVVSSTRTKEEAKDYMLS